MSSKVLISEGDWQLLEFAYGDLRRHGYEVIVEASPMKALEITKRWQPHVVIVSGSCLAEWEKVSPSSLEEIRSIASVLATISADEPSHTWRQWSERGCDVLFKPLVHPSELRAAADQAIKSLNRTKKPIRYGPKGGKTNKRLQNPRQNRKSPA